MFPAPKSHPLPPSRSMLYNLYQKLATKSPHVYIYITIPGIYWTVITQKGNLVVLKKKKVYLNRWV